MESNNITEGILKAIKIIVGIAIVSFFLFKIQLLIVYILIAFVVSLIGRPIIQFLTNKFKIKRIVSIIITMFLFFISFFGIFSLFIPLIIKQGENLSELNIELIKANIEKLYMELAGFLSNHLNLSRTPLTEDFLDTLSAYVPVLFNSLFSAFGSISVGAFITIFIAFFFMKEDKMFENIVITIFSKTKESKIKHSFETIKSLLSRYFIGLVFQVTILFFVYLVTLLIVGVQNAAVIAFLCALLNLIPYVGPLINISLLSLFTMSDNLEFPFLTVVFPKMLGVISGFLIGLFIDVFFSQPFIYSNSVKSHPLEIFLIIIIGGLLFGVVGMLLAVPSYTVLKVVLKEFIPKNRIVIALTKKIE